MPSAELALSLVSAAQAVLSAAPADIAAELQRQLFEATVALAVAASSAAANGSAPAASSEGLWALARDQLAAAGPAASCPVDACGARWPANHFLTLVVERDLHATHVPAGVARAAFEHILGQCVERVQSLGRLTGDVLRQALPSFLVAESCQPVRAAFERWLANGVDREFWSWPSTAGRPRVPTPVLAVLATASDYQARLDLPLDRAALLELAESRPRDQCFGLTGDLRGRVGELSTAALQRLRSASAARAAKAGSCRPPLRDEQACPEAKPPCDLDMAAALVRESLAGDRPQVVRVARAQDMICGVVDLAPALAKLIVVDLAPEVLNPAVNPCADQALVSFARHWSAWPHLPPALVTASPRIQHYRAMHAHFYRALGTAAAYYQAARQALPHELLDTLLQSVAQPAVPRPPPPPPSP